MLKRKLYRFVLFFLLFISVARGQQMAGIPGFYVTNQNDTIRTNFWENDGFSDGIVIAPQRQKIELQIIGAILLRSRESTYIRPGDVKFVVYQYKHHMVKYVTMHDIVRNYYVPKQWSIMRHDITSVKDNNALLNRSIFVKQVINDANLSQGWFYLGRGRPGGVILTKSNSKPFWASELTVKNQELLQYLGCPVLVPIIDSIQKESSTTPMNIEDEYKALTIRYNQLCPSKAQ